MARTETITVVFTDLVGSTELASALGHDAYETLRRDHFSALRAAVAAHNGTEVKTTGDGLMVTFASAAAALSCAVAMQQAADLHARQLPALPLAIRVGASSGEATREDNDLYGPPVVEAARLCAVAEGGQIIVADVVRLMARGRGHAFTALGELTLKGFDEPVTAHRVSWEPLPQASADTPPIPLPPLLGGGEQFQFAGREAELTAMTATWQQVAAGTRRVVFIAGEPGIGKTRLAAETARLAHLDGASVLYGRCDEDMGVPFQPFVEALASFIEYTPVERLRAQLGRYAGELVRLVPALANKVIDLPPPLHSDPDTERYRLFDAVAAWLTTAAAERPLVLVLDDLHWAAKPTLLLLRHVARAGESGPLLIVGTHRDTDIDRDHPLTAVLADLRRVDGVERLTLAGLDEAGVVAFLERAAGQSLEMMGHGLAHAVHEETEGNPFFVGEVLRHLVESGALVRRDDRWANARPLAEFGIPDSVREVIGRRLDRLPGAASEILTVAAVIGRDFDLAVLATLGDYDDETLLAALESAVAARLVEETGVDGYRFAHALVRATLYESLGETRRARLHRRVADAVLARRPDDVTALANHYSQAAVRGDASQAVRYCTQAGDHALSKLAYDQAVIYYHRALDLLGNATPGERRELLVRLGGAQRDAGDGAYRSTLLDAGRAAAAAGDGDRLVRAVLANTRGYPVAGRVDAERVEMLEAALTALGPADSAARARVLGTLVCELAYSNQSARIRALDREAIEMARRLGDPTTLAFIFRTRFVAIWTPDAHAERLDATNEYVHLAEQLGDPIDRWYAYSHRFHTMLTAGDIDEADRWLRTLENLDDDLCQPTQRWVLTRDKSMRALLAGQTAEAERLFTESFEIGQATGQPDALAMYVSQLWPTRGVQGRVAEIESMLDQVRDQPDMPRQFFAMVSYYYCALGRTDDAARLLTNAVANDFADHPYVLTWMTEMTSWARVAAQVRHTEAAAILYDRLAPWHDQVESNGTTSHGCVALYLGELATTLGRYDAAESHFVEALAVHERIRAPYWLAQTGLDWAAMLLQRQQSGDGARAQTLIDRALIAARKYGFGGVESDALRLAAGRPEVPSRDATA
jgi:class 3 adenylate cyclase/tetratricopeptide (TPR) repeat protein